MLGKLKDTPLEATPTGAAAAAAATAAAGFDDEDEVGTTLHQWGPWNWFHGRRSLRMSVSMMISFGG